MAAPIGREFNEVVSTTHAPNIPPVYRNLVILADAIRQAIDAFQQDLAQFNVFKEDQSTTFETRTECLESMGMHVRDALDSMMKTKQLYAKIADDLDDVGESPDPAVSDYIKRLAQITHMMSELYEKAQGISEGMEMVRMQQADSNRGPSMS